MDINRALRTAASTGRVLLGLREAEQGIGSGKAKLVILANNAPKEHADKVRELSRKKGVPLYDFTGPNWELGPACGKPFGVASVTVLEAGESDILALARGL